MEQENKNRIIYPAIGFDGWGSVFGIRDEYDLIYCTYRGLKKGFYHNLTIFDSDCKMIAIKDAKNIGLAPFSYWLNMLDIGIKVELNVDSVEALPLEDFKGALLHKLTRQRILSRAKDVRKCINNSNKACYITKYVCDIYYKQY